MTLLVYMVSYLGLAVFLAGSLARVVRHARAPVHLRWELYPVPHEAPERAAHGGSYFERSQWWREARHINRAGEVAATATELLLLKTLWQHNRRLWRVSFAFHFGLYLLIATTLLVFAVAELALLAPAVSGFVAPLPAVYRITGIAGCLLVAAGAIGLLWRRIADPQLRNYTTPADFFNLVFFIATVGTLAAGYLLRPAGAGGVQAIARGLLTFDGTVHIPPLFAVGMMLAATLAAYIPQTHMAHFIGKFFTYHAVRWDDTPSQAGSPLEAKVNDCLGYRPTWSAAHVGADGRRSWADIAAGNPPQEAKP